MKTKKKLVTLEIALILTGSYVIVFKLMSHRKSYLSSKTEYTVPKTDNLMVESQDVICHICELHMLLTIMSIII